MTPDQHSGGMVEKVARALCAHDDLDWDAQANPFTSGSGDDNQVAYLSAARAAIEAMRGPTRAMIYTGEARRESKGEGASRENYDAAAIFTAMIDAALSEGEEG